MAKVQSEHTDVIDSAEQSLALRVEGINDMRSHQKLNAYQSC